MTIICHTIHFIETCLPNDFGPIFFCWGCMHGKPLYRGILCRSKGYKVYKVASPGKNDFFQGFNLDWPLYRDEDLPWKGSSGWWGSWVRRAPKGWAWAWAWGLRARARAQNRPLSSQGLFPLYRLQTCGHSSLYQAILYKVGRKASSELYMGDISHMNTKDVFFEWFEWHLCHLQTLPDEKPDPKTNKAAAAAFFGDGWISWGLRHQVDQVGLTEVLCWVFFHQQRLHQGSDINPEYVEYVYNIYIINIEIVILITVLRQYMTIYIQIFIYIHTILRYV